MQYKPRGMHDKEEVILKYMADQSPFQIPGHVHVMVQAHGHVHVNAHVIAIVIVHVQAPPQAYAHVYVHVHLPVHDHAHAHVWTWSAVPGAGSARSVSRESRNLPFWGRNTQSQRVTSHTHTPQMAARSAHAPRREGPEMRG